MPFRRADGDGVRARRGYRVRGLSGEARMRDGAARVGARDHVADRVGRHSEVHGHGDEPGPLEGPVGLEELQAVRGRESDAVADARVQAVDEPGGDARRALGEFAVGDGSRAVVRRFLPGELLTTRDEQVGEAFQHGRSRFRGWLGKRRAGVARRSAGGDAQLWPGTAPGAPLALSAHGLTALPALPGSLYLPPV